jgi:hypothetical protein
MPNVDGYHGREAEHMSGRIDGAMSLDHRQRRPIVRG